MKNITKKLICGFIFFSLLNFSLSAGQPGTDKSNEIGQSLGQLVLKEVTKVITFSVSLVVIKVITDYFMRNSVIEHVNVKRENDAFYAVDSEQTRFSDVIGLDFVVKEVQEYVDFLKNPIKYVSLGARMPKGILLLGAPGTGKTLLARAIAGEAGCTFISVSGSQFVNKYVGVGADNVRKLFETARQNTPAIIFIDEIDGLANRKLDDGGGGSIEYNNTVNELLKQMNGFEQDEEILVIGATNFPEKLDSALLRPKRFDRKVELFLPVLKGRENILQYYLEKIVLDEQLCADEIAIDFAERTKGFSPAKLEHFVNEAAILAGSSGNSCVRKQHFEQAFDKVLLGVENDLSRTKDQLWKTACHEAGHALVAVLTDQPISKVSILSRGNALGVTVGNEKHELYSDYSQNELFSELMCLQGGFVAEQLMLGEGYPGVSDDLKRANELASRMVKCFGMGEGVLRGIVSVDVVSDEAKQLFDQEFIRLVQNSLKKTEELLVKNKTLLGNLAKVLLEKETLSKDEVYNIVKIHKNF